MLTTVIVSMATSVIVLYICGLFSKPVATLAPPKTEPCTASAFWKVCATCSLVYAPPYNYSYAFDYDTVAVEKNRLARKYCNACVDAAYEREQTLAWVEDNFDKVKKLANK